MRLFLFLCFPAASAVDVIPSLEIRMDSANQHSPTPACVRIAGQQASTIITTTAHRVAARFSNGLGGALLERVVLHLLSTTYIVRVHVISCGMAVSGSWGRLCAVSRSVLGECAQNESGSLPGIPQASSRCTVMVSYYIPRITISKREDIYIYIWGTHDKALYEREEPAVARWVLLCCGRCHFLQHLQSRASLQKPGSAARIAAVWT